MSDPTGRTRVKVCGITRARDARLAIDLGADALGLVRVPASPRHVSLAQAARLRGVMDGLVHCVLLVLNPSAAEVREAVAAVQPGLIQFHGTEPADFCARFGVPYIKALSQSEFMRQRSEYNSASLLLVDSHEPGQMGGTGRRIETDIDFGDAQKPVLLAGGLNPDNVRNVIQSLRPYGVDVSSGLETSPGIKDPDLVRQFFRQVRLADQSA